MKKNTISGYYTHTDSRITYSEDHSNTKENYNLFATEKQAKSALAMARISQIMANDNRFGGIITDEKWGNNVPNYYVILKVRNILVITTSYRYEYLAFHTEEQANLFLEENEDLIKDYYMPLGMGNTYMPIEKFIEWTNEIGKEEHLKDGFLPCWYRFKRE